jgi:hypothetical protein
MIRQRVLFRALRAFERDLHRHQDWQSVHRSACVAYTFANVAGTTACFLLSTVDGLVASPDSRSALK